MLQSFLTDVIHDRAEKIIAFLEETKLIFELYRIFLLEVDNLNFIFSDLYKLFIELIINLYSISSTVKYDFITEIYENMDTVLARI